MRVLDLIFVPQRRRVYTLLTAAILVICAPFADSAEEIKPDIRQALDAADTARAIDLLKAEIEIDPGYYLNYYILGRIYYEWQQYTRARDYLQTAVEKKSKHWESLYLLGRCQLALEDLEAAEKTMKEGQQKAKNSEKGCFENGFGLVMMARKNYVDADRAFRAALIIDPENAEYHINLGDANYYQGIPSLAISEYEKALAVDTASLEVYYHWAEACLEMNDYVCAIDKLKIVLQKDSTHAPAWMRAGGIYFKAAMSTRTPDDRKVRFLDAIGAYQRYLELSQAKPDSAKVRAFFETAMAYVNVGGFEEAVKYFRDVLSIPYEPRDIYFYMGKALWGLQDFEASGVVLDQHLEWLKKPGNKESTRVDEAELYQYLGDAFYYREDKDFYKAIDYYNRSMEVNPDQKRVAYNLAFSYHRTDQFGAALKTYQKRIDMGIDSSKASVYKNAAYCALSIARGNGQEEDEGLGEEDEAMAMDTDLEPDARYYDTTVAYLDQYLVFAPDEAKTLLLAAQTCLYQLADCARGVDYYQRVLEVEPNNCEAKKALGYAYFGGICTKNFTKALSYLLDAQQCVAAADGGCADVDLILWIAQCYHLRAVDKSKDKSGAADDFQNANKWYSQCLGCQPGNQVCKKGFDDTSFEF